MTSPDNNPLMEVRRLADRLVDGTATPDDSQRLSSLVVSDPAARREYLAYIELHGRLSWALSFPEPAPVIDLFVGNAASADSASADAESGNAARGDAARSDAASETPTELTGSSPVLGFLHDTSHRVREFVSQPTPLSLTIALLVVGGLLAGLSSIYLQSEKPVAVVSHREPVAEAVTVASITREVGAKWAPWQLQQETGAKLATGARLELVEGMAEITLLSGAKIILQAPAIVGLDSENSGHLSSGRITAVVPPQAVGFSIATPAATIVDLGTQFGVSVDQRGTSRIHVFEGRVEVESHAPGGVKNPVRKLVAGESLRVRLSGQIDLDVSGKEKFATLGQFEKLANRLPVTAGLVVWLKADQGLVRDEQNRVIEWKDQSPAGYQFRPLGSSPTGSSKSGPTVAAAGMNGKPVVRFDGVSGVLASGEKIQLFDSPGASLTAIMVFRSNRTEGQKFILCQTSTSSDDKIQLGYDVGDKQGSGNFGIHRGSQRATVAPAGTINDGEATIITAIVLPGGAAPSNIQIFKNGTPLTPLVVDDSGWYNAGSYPMFAAQLLVGGRLPYGDLRKIDGIHNGDIAELVIYRRSLKPRERLAVERFLRKKWLSTVN